MPFLSSLGLVGNAPRISPPPAEALRTVANNIFVQSGNNAGIRNAMGFIWTYTIGSGAVASLTLSLHNCLTSSGVEVTGNDPITVGQMAIVYNGAAVQITKSGSASFTLAAGANDVQADAIAATAFGVAAIPRDAKVTVIGYIYLPVINTSSFPTVATLQPAFNASDEAFTFENYLGAPTNILTTGGGAIVLPSHLVATCTMSGTTATCTLGAGAVLPKVGSAINFAGATTDTSTFNRLQTITSASGSSFTFTTAAAKPSPSTSVGFSFTSYKTASSAGYRPILLGIYASGDPRTEFHGGDSIDVGLNDNNPAAERAAGMGMHARSCRSEGTYANQTSYINCAVGGSNIGHFIGANQRSWAYMKYCKYGAGKHITNSFGPTGVSANGATFLADMRQWWAAMKANGIEKVLAVSAPPRGILVDLPITSVAVAANIATVTTPSPHLLASGTTVTIAGATPSGLNGSKTVTVINATMFTYATSSITDQVATGTITYQDRLATYQGQLVGPDYAADGYLQSTYYAAMAAEISAGRIDGFIEIAGWHGTGADFYKWVANGTSNYASTDTAGLHPSGATHQLAGIELAAKKAAMGW